MLIPRQAIEDCIEPVAIYSVSIRHTETVKIIDEQEVITRNIQEAYDAAYKYEFDLCKEEREKEMVYLEIIYRDGTVCLVDKSVRNILMQMKKMHQQMQNMFEDAIEGAEFLMYEDPERYTQ